MIAPQLSPMFQKGFAKTARLLLRKNFEGVFLSLGSSYGGAQPWPEAESPLFLFANHVAWHDALVAPEICVNQMRRRSLAPMDQEQFAHYRSLRYVGIFGVQRGDAQSAQLLIEDELRRHPETCIWIHPEGEFNPSFEDCAPFRSGLSRWSNRAGMQRVPVALDYAFGPNPKPSIFLRIGPQVAVSELSLAEDSEKLRAALVHEKRELRRETLVAHTGARADYSKFVRLI